MKRIILIISFLSATMAQAKSGMIIKGKILHPLADEIKFSFFDNLLTYSQKEVSAKLAADGSFSVKVPYVGPSYIELFMQHGNQESELYVNGSEELTMSVDAKRFDSSLKFTGKGNEVANFSAMHVRDKGLVMMFGKKMGPVYVKGPDEFIPAAKAEIQIELDYLAAHKKGLPADFIRYWQDHYTYALYGAMLNYPFYHERYKNNAMPSTIPKENYKVALQVPEQFDDKGMELPVYTQYLTEFYSARLDAAGIMNSSDSAGKIVYTQDDSAAKLANVNMPSKTRAYYFASKLYRGSKMYPMDKLEADYAMFTKQFPASEYNDELEEVVSLRRKMQAGQPAMDFEFTTVEGKRMKLSDLKGKVVFLDFWASWCGPCIREMPGAKKVKEYFKDKNVAFINISIDEDTAAWKKAMEKHGITGLNTCQPGWQAPIPKSYGIQSIPSYYLLDKQGRFALENTPRAGDADKLIQEIEKLLQ